MASAIAAEIRAVLRSSDADRPRPAPMESLGLDSLMALELRNRLEASLGITLPAALVWAYPTITDLADAAVRTYGLRVTRPMRSSTLRRGVELLDEEMDLLSDLVKLASWNS